MRVGGWDDEVGRNLDITRSSRYGHQRHVLGHASFRTIPYLQRGDLYLHTVQQPMETTPTTCAMES